MQTRTRFSFLDIFRIIGGLIFLNALLSYTFTGGSTWGYRGKWIDTRFLSHSMRGYPQRQFSMTDLQQSIQEGKYYLVINGHVFDVGANAAMYSKSSRYSIFIGQDCTRAFVTGCFDCPCSEKFSDLPNGEKEVGKWHLFYNSHNRYWQVGILH